MNRILLIAVGVAAAIALAMSALPLKAQVYSDYEGPVIEGGHPYAEIQYPGKHVIPANDFGLPKTFPKFKPEGRDDGYVKVPLEFPFTFNGTEYTEVYVCVNGFITFGMPPTTRQKNPSWLFKYNTAYAKNVIAPFYGDHWYVYGLEGRPEDYWDKFLPSEISYKTETGADETHTFTVQWKNLNINDHTLSSSVANFQVKLIESTIENSTQGDIVFSYGLIGGNTSTTLTDVEYKNASVGIKGEMEETNSRADFLNGLIHDDAGKYQWNKDSIRLRTDLTYKWQPSGGSDKWIVFKSLGRRKSEGWGDGDTDFSSLEGKKHAGMPQSRYVTVNDARMVMRSIVTNVPLDSVKDRYAYHADVDHNGRFFYYYKPGTDEVIRYSMEWKNEKYTDSIAYIVLWDDAQGKNVVVPSGINSPKRLYFQVQSKDAAMILDYIGGRLVKLPWLYDYNQYGKEVSNNTADNMTVGSAVQIGNSIKMPIYLNGYYNGPVSIDAVVNGTINDIITNGNDDNRILADFHNNKFVICASGEFDSNVPVCYLEMETSDNVIAFNEVKFNSENRNAFSMNLGNIDESYATNNVSINPNPYNYAGDLVMDITVAQSAEYTVSVYDMMGNKVCSMIKSLNAGQNTVTWNALDNTNNRLVSGVYIVRIDGVNTSISTQLVVSK